MIITIVRMTRRIKNVAMSQPVSPPHLSTFPAHAQQWRKRERAKVKHDDLTPRDRALLAQLWIGDA